MEVTDKFVYLGSFVDSTGYSSTDILPLFGLASSVMGQLEFVGFSFHVGLLFLSTFRLSNRTPKITRILTLYQANAATLMPFSKEGKILIKSLQEC